MNKNLSNENQTTLTESGQNSPEAVAVAGLKSQRTALAIGLVLTFSSFFLGIGFALLCHYVDYGWNPGVRLWAKVSLIIQTLVAGVVAVSCLVALAKLNAPERDADYQQLPD